MAASAASYNYTQTAPSQSGAAPQLLRQPSSASIQSRQQQSTSRPFIIGEQDASSSNQQSAHSSIMSAPSAFANYDGPYLKSQYPADSAENHVEYILVASFDIDRGSVMEHQYPGPISGDEHMLAELMLPDQAHVRSSDWTIFFLHKDTSAEEEAREERRQQRRIKKAKKYLAETGQDIPPDDELDLEALDLEEDDSTSSSEDESEGPPLIYVLNLVNTKQDQTVKRGAIVKAMAICTRHSFLHIYKPLLLLALEEYFRAPVLDTLASLYNAVNSMDLSLMPRLTNIERNILQATDQKEMFVEKFSLMIQQRMAEDAQRNSQSSQQSAVASPGASRYQLPRDTHEFESRVQYNGVPVPIKVPVAVTPETVGDFSLVKLVTTFSTPHSQSPQPFTVHPHLTTSGPYTHPIIVLINALLTQKRIIFLGHNLPSGNVAEAVLAACALASGGILKGFTRHAFPYTDLTKIDDLLKVPGFIAGVTNPAFAHKPEWFDLICDMTTGRMRISNKIEGASITDGLLYFQSGGPGNIAASKDSTNGDSKSGDPTGDTAFMDSVMVAISHRHGEAAVRNKFRAWVHRFTLIAAAFEEVVYGASALNIGASETDADAYGYGVSGHGLVWPDEATKMREVQANVGRVEGWRQSRSYFSLIRDLARQWEKGECVRGIDLGYQIERLRGLRVGDAGAADIYLAIARAVERAGVEPEDPDWENPGPLDMDDVDAVELSEEERDAHEMRIVRRENARYDVVNQLLSVLPEANGGLFYLSLGLFHKNPEVRIAIVGLLERVMAHDVGRLFWGTLGRFAKLAFFRNSGKAVA